MSIFNFRRGRPASETASVTRASSATTTESVEMVRKRARQRLIGSAVLVLIGVVGFPLLFETQPRPVPVDIAIEIPSRASIKPAAPILPVGRGEPAPAVAPEAEAPVTPPAPVAPQASLQDKEEIVEAAPTPPKPEVKAEAKPEPKSAAKPAPKPEPVTVAKIDDGQRAQALLEGGAAKVAAPAETRIVIQVGAFSDAAKAREARAKLEKAGLKTYTQMTDTKEGTRIRVRVGPYASKAEADKAAAKVKALNLPAAILVL